VTPKRRRIAIIGHQPVNADWKRFAPTKAVKMRLHRARLMVRKTLEAGFAPGEAP